jgi:hypothetical protein
MNTNMILFSMGALVAGVDADARSSASYRETEIQLKVKTMNGDEVKKLRFYPYQNIEVVRHGEPEIESHGFYDYNVVMNVSEGNLSCKTSVLLMQGSGDQLSTAEVLASKSDRGTRIRTCSGLGVSIPSVRSLLIAEGETLKADLFAPGILNPIGTGTAVTRLLQDQTQIDD